MSMMQVGQNIDENMPISHKNIKQQSFCLQLQLIKYLTQMPGHNTGLFCYKNPSPHQFITYSFFVIQTYTYQLYKPAFQPSYSFLFISQLHYVLLLFIITELIIINRTDTRDPLLIDPQNQENYQPQQLVLCIICDKLVLRTSYHCWRCGHCSHNLDHHCKYLNTCIGEANYIPFLRLLTVFLLYLIEIYYNLGWEGTILKQIIIVITVCEGLLVLSLIVFHIVINCWIGLSTLQVFRRKRAKQQIQLQQETPGFN